MKRIIYLVALALIALPALSQTKNITIEDWLGGKFYQYSVWGIRPMNDGNSFSSISHGVIKKTSYADASEQTIAALPRDVDDYQFSADEKKILYYTESAPIYRRSFYAKYYTLNLEDQTIDTLCEGDSQRMASLSPDGSKVAYILQNNILLKDLNTGKTTNVTTDGEINKIINGVPDWVYEEEFEFNKAYEFSPNSRYIAYIKFNEANVKSYTLQYFMDDPDLNYPIPYEYKYPKAGESNSIVSVHIYDTQTGETRTADLGSETDIYVPRIQWTNGNTLCICRMNRSQNQLQLLKYDTQTTATSMFYEQSDSKYIEESTMQNIIFIENGSKFIIMSEKSGSRQLYLYSSDGKLINAITDSPEHEVIEPYGYSEKEKRVYYKAVGSNSTQEAIYSIGLNGKKPIRITNAEGISNAEFSSNFQYFVHIFSNAHTPRCVSICNNSGKEIRVLQDNKTLKARMKEYGIAEREFFTWKNSNGDELNGFLLKPRKMDPNKKYPVLVVGYNGPNHCEVNDELVINWQQILVQKNYIIACTDTRGTGRKGSEFRKSTYKQLGNLETQDLIEFGKYLSKQKFIDGSRLGIWGWSYGGFMASNVMTRGNGLYKMGIAIAPVENWEYYDNIYTERYMGLPKDNPDGYRNNSPITHAKNLKGKLLLIYGSADDNVHPQNSMIFAEALVQANKDFDMHVYTNKNHSIYGGNTSRHLYTKIINYILNNL